MEIRLADNGIGNQNEARICFTKTTIYFAIKVIKSNPKN
jgi:hypothetical protein